MEREAYWHFIWWAFDGWIGQAVFMALAPMTVAAIAITGNRILRYRTADKDSCAFKISAGMTLRKQSQEQLIGFAQGNRRPNASVIVAGLIAFQKARLFATDSLASDAAKRAAKVAARIAHHRMIGGLNYLSAIVATAIFVGVFGTCYDLITSFKGCVGSRKSCMAALSYEFSRSLVPMVWGFLIAIPSKCVLTYLESRVTLLDLEMETVALDLMNYFARRDEPDVPVADSASRKLGLSITK